MSLKLRAATAVSIVVASIALIIAPASATVIRSTGCIEWSTAGCAVTQTCTVNTDVRSWSCYTVPRNGTQPVIEGGTY